jgi:hypothetical protein
MNHDSEGRHKIRRVEPAIVTGGGLRTRLTLDNRDAWSIPRSSPVEFKKGDLIDVEMRDEDAVGILHIGDQEVIAQLECVAGILYA